MIADADVREVEPSCIDVPKRGGGAAVIAEEDTRGVDPSCVDMHKRG